MRGVLRILLYLVTIALGLFLAAVYYRPELVDVVADAAKTMQGRWVIAGAAVSLLSSPLVILLRWFQSIRRNREISYDTDNGKISVSLVAIEEALTRAVEGEPEVKKALVKIFEDRVKRAVIIDATVVMWEVPNVTDRNRFCQRLLRRRFAELMPEQSQVDVNLHLHRLTERRIESAAQRPAVKTAKAGKSGVADEPSPANPDTASGITDTTVHPAATSGINPVVDALHREPDESELYVGPTYPIDDTDDDGERPVARR
jgi:hypothetical protein